MVRCHKNRSLFRPRGGNVPRKGPAVPCSQHFNEVLCLCELDDPTAGRKVVSPGVSEPICVAALSPKQVSPKPIGMRWLSNSANEPRKSSDSLRRWCGSEFESKPVAQTSQPEQSHSVS